MRPLAVLIAGLCQFMGACIHRPNPNPRLVMGPILKTDERPTLRASCALTMPSAENDNGATPLAALQWRQLGTIGFDRYLDEVVAQSDRLWAADQAREAISTRKGAAA